jgi:hypothetical protein
MKFRALKLGQKIKFLSTETGGGGGGGGGGDSLNSQDPKIWLGKKLLGRLGQSDWPKKIESWAMAHHRQPTVTATDLAVTINIKIHNLGI